MQTFFLASIIACGLEGSLVERLKDCALLNEDSKGTFKLITRTSEGKSIYLDDATGMIWSYPLTGNFNHANADLACKSGLVEFPNGAFNWQLPTIEQIRTAESNGIRSALTLEKHYYWSASIHHTDESIAWLYDGTNGDVFLDLRSDDFYNVVCVSNF